MEVKLIPLAGISRAMLGRYSSRVFVGTCDNMAIWVAIVYTNVPQLPFELFLLPSSKDRTAPNRLNRGIFGAVLVIRPLLKGDSTLPGPAVCPRIALQRVGEMAPCSACGCAFAGSPKPHGSKHINKRESFKKPY